MWELEVICCLPNLLARKQNQTVSLGGMLNLVVFSNIPRIFPGEAENFLHDLPVSELPGIGWSLGRRLEEYGIYTCGDMQTVSQVVSMLRTSLIEKANIQTWFGKKLGKKLLSYSKGVDKRMLEPFQVELPNYCYIKYCQHRKSIGVEVTWGIRFSTDKQVLDFIHKLLEELHVRSCFIEFNSQDACEEC